MSSTPLPSGRSQRLIWSLPHHARAAPGDYRGCSGFGLNTRPAGDKRQPAPTTAPAIRGETPRTPVDDLIDSQSEANFWNPERQLRRIKKRSVPPRPEVVQVDPAGWGD